MPYARKKELGARVRQGRKKAEYGKQMLEKQKARL